MNLRRHVGVTHLGTAAALLLSAFLSSADGCTAFLLRNGARMVVGENFDWETDDGLVFVNKRDIAKTAATTDNPARWTSRFGNVTFNQYGREFPLCGMNEAGLVVATLWLEETALPLPGPRKTVTCLQWVQYQLDNCATVSEVLASDSRIAILPGPGSSLHFFVADTTGACASVEFIAGRPIFHTGTSMPLPVLANNSYPASAAFAWRLKPFGGPEPMPYDFSSLSRFTRAADYVRGYRPEDSVPMVDYVFNALNSVSSGMMTKWSIAYDLQARRVWFRTFRNQQVRSLELRSFDFSGRTPVRMLDLNAPLAGGVEQDFSPYRFEANRDLVFRVYRRIEFLKQMPVEALERIARYPETTKHVGP